MASTTRPIIVRRSRIHGRGVFASRRIRPGTRIIEYTGELIDDDEIARRYGDRPDGHTMLFSLDNGITIDATRRGSIARYVNHSCDGNCRTIEDEGRIYIEAARNIQKGAELTYDYCLSRPGRMNAAERAAYDCRCGAASCRGTLLNLPKRTKKKTARVRSA